MSAYHTMYVIKAPSGALHGPFKTPGEAADWAVERVVPWRLNWIIVPVRPPLDMEPDKEDGR